MTAPTTTARPADPTGARRPPAATAAAVLGVLLALAGGYGALYFTGLEGWDESAVRFVTTYAAWSVLGVVAGLATWVGHRHGPAGLVAYGLFMVVFAVMKVLSIAEWEAIPFGVAGLVVALLALTPGTRRFAR